LKSLREHGVSAAELRRELGFDRGTGGVV
jgi:hypothetical protein